jgi:hypothetical protein
VTGSAAWLPGQGIEILGNLASELLHLRYRVRDRGGVVSRRERCVRVTERQRATGDFGARQGDPFRQVRRVAADPLCTLTPRAQQFRASTAGQERGGNGSTWRRWPRAHSPQILPTAHSGPTDPRKHRGQIWNLRLVPP